MNQIIRLFIASLFLWNTAVFAQDEVPVLKFGLMADAQYADCPPSIGRHYREALPKMDTCIQFFNEQQVECIINLGDIIDRDIHDLDKVLQHLAISQSPIYHLTGNHDYKGLTDCGILYQKLGMPAEYYSLQKNGWTFIMLNTNEISAYATNGNAKKEQELKEMLSEIRRTNGKQAYNWNGGISQKQMQWLDSLLIECEKRKQPVIVCTHHPLYPFNEYTALNNRQILKVLERYACVKIVFSGHHHAGAFGYYHGIPMVTLEGIVETEKQNAYSIVEITQDSIQLRGYGRTPSRSFKIR